MSFAPAAGKLTRAERAVALHVLDGWSNARIAKARGVSIRTIANQLASLFRKTAVYSRAELAARYTAADLLAM